MSCRPELVTGYVDGALDASEQALVAAHLETCAVCREQAEAERSLRARLRALDAPEPPFGLEQRLRARLRQPRGRRWARVLLPLAAGLAVLVLWMRGSPGAVSLELVFDHVKCFRKSEPPAKVTSGDAATVAAWFESQGTFIREIPSRAAGIELRGARHCPLLDGTSVAHVYYFAGSRPVSLFVIPRPLRLAGEVRATRYGRAVRLWSEAGHVVAVVAERDADADAMAAALRVRMAGVR